MKLVWLNNMSCMKLSEKVSYTGPAIELDGMEYEVLRNITGLQWLADCKTCFIISLKDNAMLHIKTYYDSTEVNMFNIQIINIRTVKQYICNELGWDEHENNLA